ncbi:hypothetical protein GM3709_3865 (plasmid) [Geminocystis sp. NIES-3709]|nr:hypothetical protein GM3709_3865 [Geminocystis sp. NIES-3709]
MYDCEIIKLIPTWNSVSAPYQYCTSAKDYEGMGISVVGTWRNYDIIGYHKGRGIALPLPLGKYEAFVNNVELIGVSLSYLPQFEYLQELLWEADLIVGFNTSKFDDHLMTANGFEVMTDYDLYWSVKVAVGEPSSYVKGITTKGHDLASFAKANGMAKTGTGALAPILWQTGYRQQVIDYCLNDVKLLNKLYWKKQNGLLRDPKTLKLI